MAKAANIYTNAAMWDGTWGKPSHPHVPSDSGYDATYAKRASRSYARSNGQIAAWIDKGGSQASICWKWPLFITDVQIDFSIQGSTAQSKGTRDFYAHNFQMASFVVSGQSLDNVDYGMMCDFVHATQSNLVNTFSEKNLVQLLIPGGLNNGAGGFSGIKYDSSGNLVAFNIDTSQFQSESPASQQIQALDRAAANVVGYQKPANGKLSTFPNQSIHGTHKTIRATGIIGSIQRVHQTGVPAPTWQFEFNVFRMVDGPYREGPTKTASGDNKTWVDLLNAGMAQPNSISSTGSEILANQQALTKAQNFASAFSSTSGHGSGSGSSSGGSSSGGSSGNAPAGSMYDSTDATPSAAGIPSNAQFLAAYSGSGGGGYNNAPAWQQAASGAQVLTIVQNASGNGDCLDIENGDAVPAEAGGWVKKMLAAGHNKPCVYCTTSAWPDVKNSLDSAGLDRSQYRVWVATWSGSPDVPDYADAAQWGSPSNNSSPGARYDISKVNAGFF